MVFLPEHYLHRKVGDSARLGDYAPMADDLPALTRMVESGDVALTPAQDYDDSYAIRYARQHDACIVSNDRYWDWVQKQRDPGPATRWIRTHTISFTFVRDEFVPNPDFRFPRRGEAIAEDDVAD